MFPGLLLAFFSLAPDARAPLTFDEALGLARRHPALRARDAELEVRRARDAKISALSSNPTLLVLPGWRLPGAESPGFEIQAQVSQSIDLEGIGAMAKRAARAERAELSSRRRLEALGRKLSAAHAWLEGWRAESVLRIIDEELGSARDLAERARRAVALGASIETDALEAESYRVAVLRRRIDAEGITFERAVDLAAAMGRDADPVPLAEGPLPAVVLPPASAWPGWIERAGALPAATVTAIAARAAEARAAEASAQGSARLIPTFTAQLERPNDVLVFAGLGVQLPVFDANERARARAEAEARVARARAEIAPLEARRALRLALHEVEHARELETLARDQAVPVAERWAERAMALHERGQTDVFPTLRARARLAEARAGKIAATGARVWAEVKAWLLLATLSEAAELPAS